MRVLEYVFPDQWEPMTVKDFARNHLGLSATMLRKQKQMENGILKNGEFCRVVDFLKPGDVLAFRLPEEAGEYPAEPLPLDILWESEDYMAVNKPPAMPIHPSPGHDRDSLLNAVAYHYLQTGQSCLFRPLYRLDRDTSGVVLIGKHRAATSSAKIRKRYLALCEGIVTGSGMVTEPIGLKPGSKILRECGHGDPAVTHWEALAAEGGHTLLSLTLETGRTHQIRVHMAHLGHPLAGDDLYGGSREIISRQALHCADAEVFCPALAVERKLTAELPQDMLLAFPWLSALKI